MSRSQETRRASFSRRSFLGGLGAAALSPYLPLLNASGQENLRPVRLLLFYTPHGTVKKQWKPTGTQNSFTLPRLLAPLAPYQSKINVLSGLSMVDTGVGAQHTKGLPLLWTGSKLRDDGTFQRADGAGGTTYGWNSSLSVDQFVANSLAGKTPYKSLEFGVRSAGSNPASRMIYTDAQKPLAPAIDPWSQFSRLFAGHSDAQGAERLSALKLARDELARLSPRIASADRAKIAAHTDALNDLEKRLGQKSALCTGPILSAKTDANAVDNTELVVDAQIKLIVAALACDLTRVASFQYTVGDNDSAPYPFLGINDGHHLLTHAGDSDTDSWEKVMKIRVWYAQKFASLLAQLDAIPEGNGTLLDNTLVVWGSELGTGNTHSFKSTPFVTAGGAGGAFNTGRYLEYNEKSYHNGLLVAVCQALGLTSTTKFGNLDEGAGPLVGLLK